MYINKYIKLADYKILTIVWTISIHQQKKNLFIEKKN